MFAQVLCQCSNEFQDRRYGKQSRIATVTQKAKSPERVIVRCTVCGKEHDVPKTVVKK